MEAAVGTMVPTVDDAIRNGGMVRVSVVNKGGLYDAPTETLAVARFLIVSISLHFVEFPEPLAEWLVTEATV